MGAVETMRIVSPRDPGRCWRINRRDFDPQRHRPWVETAAGANAPEPAPLASAGPKRAKQDLETLSREDLLQQAEALGLQPDRRLGAPRLRRLLREHQAKRS